MRWGKFGKASASAVLLIVLAFSGYNLTGHCRLQRQRQEILRTPPHRLQTAGSHFVVGFDRFDEIRRLAARGAIAGIYLTRRNVKGRNIRQIRDEVDALQQLRQRAGLPPLVVAADQEGGAVNHLSPPLPHQPPLVSLVGAAVSREDLARQTEIYARNQARALAALGVNLNLSPVVDLPVDRAWPEGESRLSRRAIADDKVTVAQVADAYCRGLINTGVWPTLKHFPGLGQVTQETHRQEGILDLGVDQLSIRDWVPFRQVLAEDGAFLMLGHVRLSRVDAKHLVCASPAVVQGILREQWGFDGILITDDLNMGAARQAEGGIGAIAVQALNAGVDLLLISCDGRQYYPAMAAVLHALDQGRLDLRRLARSRRRLTGLWQPDATWTGRAVIQEPLSLTEKQIAGSQASS